MLATEPVNCQKLVFVCQCCHLPKKSTQSGVKWVWTTKYQIFQSKIGILSPKMPTVWSDPRRSIKFLLERIFTKKYSALINYFVWTRKLALQAKNFENLACLKWRRSNFVIEFSFRDLIVLTKREFWIKKNKLFRSNHQLLLGYIHKLITSMA